MEELLARCVSAWCPGATGVTSAMRLSGGASQETWSFDILHPDGLIGAILRRAPQGSGAASGRACGLEHDEAELAPLSQQDDEHRPLQHRQLHHPCHGPQHQRLQRQEADQQRRDACGKIERELRVAIRQGKALPAHRGEEP
eukprot:gene9744-13145_t